MSPFIPAAAVQSSLLVLAGCGAVPPESIDPTSIRPVAHFEPVPAPPPHGVLRVLTETVPKAQDDVGPYWVHQGYDVFQSDGAFVRHVDNHRTDTDTMPMTVRLPPGKYLIAIPQVSRAEHWIEVRVVAGCLTEADVRDLSGTTDRQARSR